MGAWSIEGKEEVQWGEEGDERWREVGEGEGYGEVGKGWKRWGKVEKRVLR